MSFDKLVLFFFSAIGAFNGLFLSIYFAFFIKNRSRATYFLSALLFVISVRVTKSVFLIFVPGVSTVFIQVGLSACVLIGPFLYLYVKASVEEKESKKWTWLLHIVPLLIAMILIGIYYPYRQNYHLWRRVPPGIFGFSLVTIWSSYVLYSLYLIRGFLKKLFSKQLKLNSKEKWVLSVTIGNVIICLAYNTSQYTSYIVGAFSFSFVFYLMILLWFFRRNKNLAFLEKQEKYANKKIDKKEALSIEENLEKVIIEKQLFKNQSLKISDVAEELQMVPHLLSQFLNDNLGKSFTFYINEYRVREAEKMLKTADHLTLQAIGSECGFKSNSTFYATFKKVNGMTPAKFKKEFQ
jgi:AraC-like DNA-binding protein